MTYGELLYLAMVLGAFASFAAVLATVSTIEQRDRKRRG